MKRDCAFQYYSGHKVVVDDVNLTLLECKVLWNEWLHDMVEKASIGVEIEVAIWINMKKYNEYNETLIHLHNPEVREGKLYEPKYYEEFEL